LKKRKEKKEEVKVEENIEKKEEVKVVEEIV